MDKDIKEKWLTALKSGEYKKGTGRLRSINNTFCCLGVLCDLVDKNGWDACGGGVVNGYAYKGEVSYLVLELRRKFGINKGDMLALSNINDRNTSFEKVIEYIQEEM